MVKNPPANAGDLRDAGLIPGSGRSPGGGHGNPLQYSCLQNPMDRGAWRAPVHWVTKSWTRLTQLSIHACIIALQHRVSFSYTEKWIRYMYTCIVSVLDFLLGHHRALNRGPCVIHLPLPPPLPQYPLVCSLLLCLCFCFMNKFSCSIFLASTRKQNYTIFVFLFQTCFTLYDNL